MPISKPDGACDDWQAIHDAWYKAEHDVFEFEEKRLDPASKKLDEAFKVVAKSLVKLNLSGLLGGIAAGIARVGIALNLAVGKVCYDAADKTDTVVSGKAAFDKAAAEYTATYKEYEELLQAAQEAYEDLCDCESGD